MRVRNTLFLLGCFVVVFCNAQSKREWLEYGNDEYGRGNYASSIYYYMKVIGKGGSKSKDVAYPYDVKYWIAKDNGDSTTSKSSDRYAYVTHKIADAYRLNRDYDNAELWYADAVENPNEQFPNSRYWYAVSLMSNGKYTDAEAQFTQFIEENATRTDFSQESTEFQKLAQTGIMSTQFATQNQEQTIAGEVFKMDSNINAGNTDFAANFFYPGLSLVISSARAGSTMGDAKDRDPEYVSDLYVVSNDGDSWYSTQQMPQPINSAANEGAGALSVDRSTFYFTRWEYNNPKECAIYVSKFFNNQWLQPLKLDQKINLPGFRSMQPALNLDETRLYFTSDRPGGQGGLDIWYCHIDEYGNLGYPVNLGSVINTAGDEMSPFYHYQSKTLYFSSDGLPGFGGMDIYRSTMIQEWNDTTWATPVNVGSPVNSPRDDTYFIIDKDQHQGFFSSDRDKCTECVVDDQHIGSGFCYKIYEVKKPDMVFSIEGVVYDAETQEVIPNALVTFKDIRGAKEPFFIMTDAVGHYESDLEVGWELFIKAQKNKYFGDGASITTFGLTESKHFIRDFNLTPIPQGEIEIPGIEYDFDAATLRPKSKEILDDLVDFLTLNNNLVVEIASHTDVRGNDSYNQKLSEDRAKSCVNYLIAHGIDRERLLPKGYGETQLLIKNAKTEEEHQRNRRTTFTVLKEDEVK